MNNLSVASKNWKATLGVGFVVVILGSIFGIGYYEKSAANDLQRPLTFNFEPVVQQLQYLRADFKELKDEIRQDRLDCRELYNQIRSLVSRFGVAVERIESRIESIERWKREQKGT